MRRTAVFAGVLVIAGMVLGVALTRLTQTADARETCNVHSLKGPFGYARSGSTFVPSGATTAKEIADTATGGRVVFDGHGGLKGDQWSVVNGAAQHQEFTGTDTVDRDCTGNLTLTITGTTMTDHFNFTLVDNGRQIKLIQRDKGSLQAGTAIRAKQDCTVETLHSRFGYALTGDRFASSAPLPGTPNEFADIVASGHATFNGDGTGAGADILSVNGGGPGGAPFARTYSFTYTLESDCTGTLTLTTTSPSPPPPPGRFHIVVVDDGRMVEMVLRATVLPTGDVDPGGIVAGELVRQ